MSVINSIPLIAAGDDGYQISRSVRLRSSASAYLNRTPASAGNRKTWTWSGWLKRGAFGSAGFTLLGAGTSATGDSGEFIAKFNNNAPVDSLILQTGATNLRVSNALYRDPSAHMHVVIQCDMTITGDNQLRCYVNNIELTYATKNNLTAGTDLAVNNNVVHEIGRFPRVASQYFDGYLTEINFIDGQALTPSSFGETNSITGVWQPKKYAGTYGTNGFYLNFSDNSAATATTIGKDYSGNGNNWTPNNISVTAGVTYDSMLDVPTPYADGGNGRGNYATLNAVNNGGMTLVNGNLDWTCGATQSNVVGTIAVSSGKWYFEYTPTTTNAAGSRKRIGVALTTYQPVTGAYFSGSATGYSYIQNGNKENNGSASAYGATWDNGDIIGVALDLDAGTLVFYKNNSSQGTAYSSLSGTFVAAVGDYSSSGTLNFGQRPFAYTPPTGFKALNTQNLPDATIKKGNQYFDATTYTGTGGALSVTNSGAMQPDLVWVKRRDTTGNNNLMGSYAANTYLISNLTNAEGGVSFSFNADGFSTNTTNVNWNASGGSYVGWQWKANGSGVTNTAGSITSTVSANTTSGFSIVTYTGTGANATVGHGLGVAPAMIIVKNRPFGGAWGVYHKNLTSDAYYLILNTTAAQTNTSNFWNSTAPTSTVFSLGNDGAINRNGDSHVAYCFAEVAGFSKFGSYTGNASTDGPFVYCGFRPRFILGKDSGGTNNWFIFDTARDTYNVCGDILRPNLSDAELVSPPRIDILSNGFKIRNVNLPNDATTYIFAAFAEVPFKAALAR